MFDYGAALLADSPALGAGQPALRRSSSPHDGPWEQPGRLLEGATALLRYSAAATRRYGCSVTASAYPGDWNSTDQVAARAHRRAPDFGRFGAIDDSDRRRVADATRSTASGTGATSELRPRGSSPTGSTTTSTCSRTSPTSSTTPSRRPVRAEGPALGRAVPSAHHTRFDGLFERAMENTVGLQVRSDSDPQRPVPDRRQQPATSPTTMAAASRPPRAATTSGRRAGAVLREQAPWTDWFRSVAGVRVDVFDFDVDGSHPAELRRRGDAVIASPKLSLIFGPWCETELYLNGGYRLPQQRRARRVARSTRSGDRSLRPTRWSAPTGAEIGVRTACVPQLQSSVALLVPRHRLRTALHRRRRQHRGEPPEPPLRRRVGELLQPTPWLTLDARLRALARALPRHDPAGDHIPGSIETVVAAGITVHDLDGFFGSVRCATSVRAR